MNASNLQPHKLQADLWEMFPFSIARRQRFPLMPFDSSGGEIQMQYN
jgi:hypothetical protein